MPGPRKDTPRIHPVLLGATAWALFSLFAVILRGVRWEETYEHALIISRLTPYPDGHPAFIFWRNVFSGQSYLSALLIHLADAPAWLNGYRNVLQLAFCTIPVYLLGTALGGRTLCGHVAAVLVLLGVHRNFESYYPIETWPHFYAVGQIGLGYALLVLACLLHGWWRAAWLLLGLMPVVHIGHAPAVAPVLGCAGLYCLYLRAWDKARSAAVFLVLGLLPSVLFLWVQQQFSVPLPSDGAYTAEGDVQAIWAAYSERHDLHRFNPRLNPAWKSGMGAALALAVLAGGVVSGHGRFGRRVYFGAFVFAATTSVLVGGVWLAHQALGGETPFLLIGWMPYRLLNHLAVLLVPAAVAVLLAGEGTAAHRTGRCVVGLVLLFALLQPLWRVLLPPEIFARYVENPEGLVFVLSGAALSRVGLAAFPTRARRISWALGGGVFALLIALYYPFGAAAMVAGAHGWGMLWYAFGGRIGGETRAGGKGLFARFSAALPAFTALLLGALLYGQWTTRAHLPRQPIHEDVADYLADRGEEDAMLLTPYWDIGWVGKAGHPVFADYQYAHIITYMPTLGPSIKKIHLDVYGFLLDGEPGPPLAPWPARTAGEWRRLAEAYGFHYLLAPTEMELQIPPVWRGEPYNLYDLAP